ncbi:hypothetical protein NE237_012263 [Protea cynaroides]|uniref:Uncharacterized protein n=1 Tax=Protea cynaroides TaxID=273540 RepID=A0A9Q0GZU0_9MAGN|nr:hypothetical protein NE237_012263 [Protea cynaroides]
MWNRVFFSGFLILVFLFHTKAISHHHHHHDHDHSAVLDTDGHELEAGITYYIVSAIKGGGGISIGRRESSSSQSYTQTVKHSSYEMNMGNPIMFSPKSTQNPEDQEEVIIQESMDINIMFSGMNDAMWQVEQRRQHSSGSRYVTMRGQTGDPGKSTVRNWFKIARINKDSPIYRIIYCPNVCESCHVVCGTVGINEEDGNRWLMVSKHSDFPFVFNRAQSTQ